MIPNKINRRQIYGRPDLSNPNRRMTRASCGLCAFLVVAILPTVLPSIEAQDERKRRDAESEKIIRYLERTDRDKNGILDEKELNGGMREYFQSKGIDTSRPISIAKVKRTYEAKKKAEDDARHALEIDGRRRVPKFGIGIEMPPPPDFSVETVAGANGRLEDQFDKQIVDSVKAYMKQYDNNKDGWLDENESRRIKRILGDDADADKNGKFGEMELAVALKKRMDQSQSEKASSSGQQADSGRRDRRGFGRRRGGSRSSSASDSDRSDSISFRGTIPTSRKSNTSPSSSRSGRSMSGRQTAYVDGVFKRYDEDSNGKLDKDEQKKISGSLKLVDVNGDGTIDRQEALDSLAGTAKQASTSESEGTDSSDRKSGRTRRRGSDKDSASTARTSSTSSGADMNYNIKGFRNVPIDHEQRSDTESDLKGQGADSDFLAWDEDKDGQISMVEFREGKKWTDQLVKKFQTLDENDDGLVTIDEFNANYNSRDFDD